MEQNYRSHFPFNSSVSPQGQLPVQSQTQHAQGVLTASTNPVTAAVQGHYQAPKMKADNVGLLVQAGRAEDATKTYMMPWLWAESQGIVAGVQEQSHFVNVTPRTVVPEDLMRGMVSPSGIYSSLGEDAVTGSVADTNTLGPQTSSPPVLQTQPHFAPGAQQLATIPQYVFPHGSGIGQRQQPIPCEDAQALIVGGPVLGANRTADPTTPGAFGGNVGDSWTGTLWWQCEREGPSQVRAVATDGVRNPMFSMWPSFLQIRLAETVIPILDIQAWLLKTGAPMARIKGKPGDSHRFDDLVKLVRSRSYALAGWEKGQPQFLLVPLNEDLLCTFSPTGIASLPKPQPRKPDRKKRCVPSSSQVRSQRGSRPKAPKQRSCPKAMRSALTRQPAEPHQQAQLRALSYTVGSSLSMPQPKAQRSQRVASLNTLGSSGGVDDSRAEPAVTGRSVANSSDGLGSTQLVEGNGGPRLGMPYADTDIPVSGDANMTHIPMAGLAAKEDLEFDWEKYINFEGNGDACWIGPRYY